MICNVMWYNWPAQEFTCTFKSSRLEISRSQCFFSSTLISSYRSAVFFAGLVLFSMVTMDFKLS